MRSLVFAFGVVAGLAVACGTTSSEFDEQGNAGSSGGDDPFGQSAPTPQEDLYANDPPPKWCGPAGQPAPPPPGGTLECPDDKNKPGCTCSTLGEKAACWTGLRAHRNLGICKDGVTTCQRVNETRLAWGPCEGQVLPDPNATKGAAACKCFSQGQWKIANLSPCTFTYCNTNADPCPPANITNQTTISTIVDGNGFAQCPPQPQTPPTTPPAQPWSTSTLKVDCAGHFKLCYRIRAGVFESPSPNDCIVGEVCAEADYVTPNVEQPWPDLPGWIGTDVSCSKKWAATPDDQSAGYGEMVVKGLSVRCDVIDDGAGGDLVFNRVKYCPRICNEPANASSPECVSCRQSGEGTF